MDGHAGRFLPVPMAAAGAYQHRDQLPVQSDRFSFPWIIVASCLVTLFFVPGNWPRPSATNPELGLQHCDRLVSLPATAMGLPFTNTFGTPLTTRIARAGCGQAGQPCESEMLATTEPTVAIARPSMSTADPGVLATYPAEQAWTLAPTVAGYRPLLAKSRSKRSRCSGVRCANSIVPAGIKSL